MSDFESLLCTINELTPKVKFLSLLGKGSLGEVHLATYNGKLACVKVGRKSADIDYYKNEACALFYLNGAGGVPAIYLAASDYPFIVMEYVQGKTLHEVLQQISKDSIPYAMDLLCKLGSSLNSLHTAGYVHNDIKSDNVIIEEDTNAARIIDLGFCAPIGLPGLSNQQFATPAEKMRDYQTTFSYLAPETYFELATTPAADVFSLGRLLETLMLESYFEGWPLELRLMVANMTHLVPENRPTMETVIQMLKQAVPILDLQIIWERQESLDEQRAFTEGPGSRINEDLPANEQCAPDDLT